MPGYNQAGNDAAAGDLWRRTLEQIPTVYGRLVYLATLRNANSGRYEHHGLATRFSEDQAERVLNNSHEETFREWLALSLREQKGDLDSYLSSLDDDKRVVVETWLRIMPFRNLMPGSSSGVEADLYISDFRVLLELLKHEYGAAEPDRGA
jgi:hypothetical protein